MPILEVAAAAGHGVSSAWAWVFYGTHGAAAEASVAVLATAVGGDLIAQGGEIATESLKDEDDETALDQSYDGLRVCRCAALGAIYGPIEYTYFALINSHWPWWGQVMFDLGVFTPVVTLGGILLNTAMRDNRADASAGEVGEKFLRMAKIGLPLWLVSDTVMFNWVPLRHRVLFSRVVGFFYQVYCMHVLNDPHLDPTEKFTAKVRAAGASPALPPLPRGSAEAADAGSSCGVSEEGQSTDCDVSPRADMAAALS